MDPRNRSQANQRPDRRPHGADARPYRKWRALLVTTLTKKMAEELADYLQEMGVSPLPPLGKSHSRASEILRDLRLGVYDVVVGIDLLREGLDLPEVPSLLSSTPIRRLSASSTSLIQTIGRAARTSRTDRSSCTPTTYGLHAPRDR